MSYEEYVQCITDLLSGDPKRVAAANEKLFREAVNGNGSDIRPAFALADAEQRLTR
jgi:hypothetical protein